MHTGSQKCYQNIWLFMNRGRENGKMIKTRSAPARARLKLFKNKWQLYLLLIPALIYIGIFAYAPMYGIQIAFKNYRTDLGIWGSPWVGLDNFVRFVNYPDFWRMVRNTLWINLHNLSVFPCAVIFALLLNELTSTAYKKTVQMITYLPHFFSTVVVCGLIILFLDRSSGVVNRILELVGLERVAFLSEPKLFSSIYVWSGVWTNLGWNSIMYIAALSNVSTELVEAARIDGANRLHIIWYVNLPTILPTIVTMFILSCGSMMSLGFEKIYLLQNTLNFSASNVISTYTYEIGLIGGQFSYSAAIGLFNNAVNLIMLIIVNTVSKKLSGTGIW